jgi:hypothetical protein
MSPLSERQEERPLPRLVNAGSVKQAHVSGEKWIALRWFRCAMN